MTLRHTSKEIFREELDEQNLSRKISDDAASGIISISSEGTSQNAKRC